MAQPKKQLSKRYRPQKKRGPQTAQQTIPYREMLKDGICMVRDGFFTKTIAYEDINYSVASTDDQAAIFDGYSAFLNYFDSALPFQMSFINYRSRPENRYTVNVPPQDDEFNSIRDEYVEMMARQIARSNNGIVRSKFITFGLTADNLAKARPRLDRVEADIINNYKKLGVQCHALSGIERLELLHGQLHPGGRDKFNFSWDMIPKTGMGTKDFIAPTSFDFRQTRYFRVGRAWGASSYLQIMASELSDKLLRELLELDAEMTVTMHVQTVDQTKAIKAVKTKVSDIDKMKIEAQKQAVRAGYDFDILPPDLITYSKDAAALLSDLQSRNERMFLLTFLINNTASTKSQLDNDIFTVSGIAQKHNCALKRLDFQQESGYMSSLALGYNGIEIQRGLTTSSTAIFIPFMTQELRMGGPSIYYGLNALSHNIIMADRKKLKNPNGLFLGVPGCLVGETRVQLASGEVASLADLVERGIKETTIRAYDETTGTIVDAKAVDIRISKKTDTLKNLHLSDGSVISCTDTHLILDHALQYIPAEEIPEGHKLCGGLTVTRVSATKLPHPIPVYDITVPRYLNFLLDNGVVVHNSGKSFAAKREMVNVFLVTGDRIIIVDPMGEYSPLVRRMGGQVVEIAPNSPHHINPLSIAAAFGPDDENPLALKSDFILSLCELIVAGKEGLQPVERTVIDRCVRLLYGDVINNPKTAKMPILQDLYELLCEQPEPEAKRLAVALEIYVSGSLNVFNNQTNVDLNNRVVCLDLKQLGAGLRTIAMLIMQDLVWSQVSQNFAQGISTWCYFDEFHMLLRDELTASYCVTIWKMLRKKGCLPSALTQNVKDLLASREVENILENSDFLVLLSQAQGDRQILAKQLGISEHQLSYVTHSNSGEGLLFFGNTTIPFVDRFPPGEIYDLLTTRPEDLTKEAAQDAG